MVARSYNKSLNRRTTIKILLFTWPQVSLLYLLSFPYCVSVLLDLMNNQMKEVDESTQLRILELLLNKGAYPSATNKQNLTPFDLLPSNSKVRHLRMYLSPVNVQFCWQAFQLFTAYNQQPYEQQFLGCKTQQFHNTQLPNVNEFFQTPSASNDVVLTTSIYQN